MLRAALLSTAVLLSAPSVGAAAGRAASDPFTVVTEARRAFEGDTVARVRARWEGALRRAPDDRAALLGLATLARLAADYPRAESLYVRLVAPDARRDDAYGAYARLGRALAFLWQRQPERAALQFDSARAAAAAAGRHDVLAWILITAATVRPPATRVAALDSAEVLARPADVQLRAELLCYRGALDRDAPWERRVALTDSGIVLARHTGLFSVEAACLEDKATVLLERGGADEPIRLLKAADSLLARAKLRGARVTVLYRLGFRYLDATQHGRALAAFRTGMALADSLGQHENSVRLRYGIIQTALFVNDLATAEERLREAKAILQRAPNKRQQLYAGTYEALIAQAAGDDAHARRTLEAVLPEFLAAERPANQHSLLLDIAWSAANLRDWPAALGYLAQARTLALQHRLDPALADLSEEEGRVALLRGDLARAEQLFRRALAGIDTSRQARRYGVRVRLAEVYAARGDLARAEEELRAAGEALERWRATLEDRELRLLATEVRKHGGPEAGVPRVLAALAAGGRAEAAFELAERRRARELVTRMAAAEALREEGAPASGGELRVRAALPDGRTALLEYAAGPGDTPTTLFVLTRDGVRAFRLVAADSLARHVERFVALLEAGGRPEPLARALGAALLDSAVATLGPEVERLVIVPDGILHRVPFDALRITGDRYVVERFTATTAPSAAVMRELWRRRGADPRADARRPVRLLAFGDPAFADERAPLASRDGGAYRAAFETTGGLTRLSGSGREARLVARYSPAGEVRLRREASEAFLKGAALDEFQVLHFATHALVDDRTAARTALALAPGGGEDGFLSPADLASLPLAADLVVLSACRTARGTILGGEGVQGLTAPLLQAGARSVVATSWRIGDRRAVPLVRAFYDALAARRPVGDALRAAKLAAIRRGAPPGEWAAFQVIGDPLAVIPLRTPARAAWWSALLVVGLGGACAGLAFYQARRRMQRRP